MVYPLNQFGLKRMAIHIAPNMHASTAMLKTLNAPKAATMRAYVQQLTQEQNQHIRRLESSGTIGWVNDPSIKQSQVAVVRDTGEMLVGYDGNFVLKPGQKQYPPQSYNRTTLLKAIEEFEDTVLHFYKDHKGNVTIGIGTLVNRLSDVSGMTFRDPESGAIATEEQISQDYQKALQINSTSVARFEEEMNLRLDENDAMIELEKRLDENLKSILSGKPFDDLQFRSFPAQAQMALADMAYNMYGKRFRGIKDNSKHTGFPCLITAAFHRDWAMAAKQSSRSDVGDKRNSDIRKWFEESFEKYFISVAHKRAGQVKLLKRDGRLRALKITPAKITEPAGYAQRCKSP